MTAQMSDENATSIRVGLQSVRVDPQQLLRGQAATVIGTVTLSGPAPAGGADVEVFSDQPEVVSVPEVVRVAAGALAEAFEVHVLPVEQHLATEITAAYGDTKRFTMLAIRAADADPPSVPAQVLTIVPNSERAAVEVPSNGHVHSERLGVDLPPTRGSETLVVTPVSTPGQPPPGSASQPSPSDEASPPAASDEATKPAPSDEAAKPVPSGDVSQPPSADEATKPALSDETLTVPPYDSRWPRCRQSFRASLVTAAPAIPFIGLVATLAVYATASGSMLWPFDPVGTGIAVAIVLWLLLAAVHCWVMRGTSADQVNGSAFNELRHRFGDITARFAVVTFSDDPSRIAARQVADCIRQIRAELERPGPAWIMGTGYLSVWKLVHRAEEALLLLEPPTEVIAAALYDELRLTGAQIANNDQLLSKLRLAVAHLSSEATNYLSARPSARAADGNQVLGTVPSTDADRLLARVTLREVRQTVNEFRDSGWDAIVRTRNHLVVTLTATGAATYLSLALAITVSKQARGENMESNAVLAAGAFYLVGAMLGLFNRLNTESSAQNDIEDYGLTMARLSLTPVLAGIAAVAGVFLAAMVASGVSGTVLGSATANQTVRLIPDMGAIYNLTANPFGLLLAAIFGLWPSLLINGLQDQAEKYKSTLRSTSPQSH